MNSGTANPMVVMQFVQVDGRQDKNILVFKGICTRLHKVNFSCNQLYVHRNKPKRKLHIYRNRYDHSGTKILQKNCQRKNKRSSLNPYKFILASKTSPQKSNLISFQCNRHVRELLQLRDYIHKKYSIYKVWYNTYGVSNDS